MGKLNLLFGKKKRSSNDNETPITPIPSTLTKNGTPRLSLDHSKSEFIIPPPKAISPPPSVQKEQKNEPLLDEILSELSLVGKKSSKPVKSNHSRTSSRSSGVLKALISKKKAPSDTSSLMSNDRPNNSTYNKNHNLKVKKQLDSEDSETESEIESSDSESSDDSLYKKKSKNSKKLLQKNKKQLKDSSEDSTSEASDSNVKTNIIKRAIPNNVNEGNEVTQKIVTVENWVQDVNPSDGVNNVLDRMKDRHRMEVRMPPPQQSYGYSDEDRYDRNGRYERDPLDCIHEDFRERDGYGYPKDDYRYPRDDYRYPRDDYRYQRDDHKYPKDYPRDDYRYPRDDDPDYYYHNFRQVVTGGRNDNLLPIVNKASREKIRNDNYRSSNNDTNIIRRNDDLRSRNKTPSATPDGHLPTANRYRDKSSQKIPSSSQSSSSSSSSSSSPETEYTSTSHSFRSKSPNPNVKIRPHVKIFSPNRDDSLSRKSSISSRSDVREMVHDRSIRLRSDKYKSDEHLSRKDSIRSKRSYTSTSSKSSSRSGRVNNDSIRREPINRQLLLPNTNLTARASILSVDSDIVPLGRKFGLNVPKAINETASDSQSISSNRESIASSSNHSKISDSRRKNTSSRLSSKALSDDLSYDDDDGDGERRASMYDSDDVPIQMIKMGRQARVGQNNFNMRYEPGYDLRSGPIPKHGLNGYREREDPNGRYSYDEPPPSQRYHTFQYRDDRYPPKHLPHDIPRSKYGYPPPPPPSDPVLNQNKKVPLIEMAGYRYDQTKRTVNQTNQPIMAKDSHSVQFSPESSHRGGYFPRDHGYLSQEREYLQQQERDDYNPSGRGYAPRFYDRGDRREYDRERDGYGVDRHDRYNDKYNERHNDRYNDRYNDRHNDRYNDRFDR
ncbi:hypothetical protein F8M41_001657 [Gigaspora margarita]|uniref:Uncharacterized protein n=1 Tax=Gigaspora margarita TaxID=4874 RepID=A0A8H4A938_GIGMA|nr:hypothetical protein F8M41_001657 [Gigaspora margarita]